ncbi:MAG TPA: acyl-CoA dehydratase activase [Atribacteraceae bacterium]|nr:acyl-CoA dehydratase activase [Atribacteraceae bacterium]
MKKDERYYLGLDIGSVSVDLVVMTPQGDILEKQYHRHKGHPMELTAQVVSATLDRFGGPAGFAGVGVTGNGGRPVAEILAGVFVNEVIAQATATAWLLPDVQTIVEIGGEDSKVIFLRRTEKGTTEVADFAMNTICAAGTGSFLDQQASRLGLSIEEFGQMALRSENPPRVAGRCSVFAKSDMIHLQQKATPPENIVGGLCLALARNFKSTVGSSLTLVPPVSFHGGVAANPGIERALRRVLSMNEKQLRIPDTYAWMGAIGAVWHTRENGFPQPRFDRLAEVKSYRDKRSRKSLPPLRIERSTIMESRVVSPARERTSRIPGYLGVDVGSISTNVVVMDSERNVLAKRYLMTAGRPIEAVRRGLQEVGEEIGDRVDIQGVCTTGSGRYLIGDFIGADVVRNEITAQARGALAVDPNVDTIFEIGGQDSKFIRIENGNVTDFEMNKVCAAGTGSFLEEQAEKLNVSIKEEFARLALASQDPIDLGERCTVFMETELQKNQQRGARVEDLLAGLAYSIVYNYLNRVVTRKPIGNRIFFQGGTAFNHALVAAFEQVTKKPITVPSHHEVTGALGCAIIAQEWDQGQGSRFKGFDLNKLEYHLSVFECQDCSNRCEINQVIVEGAEPLSYGSRCEKFDVKQKSSAPAVRLPDLFREREQMLMSCTGVEAKLPAGAPRIGIPRAGLFYDLFPFWYTLLTRLGAQVVISDKTSKPIIHRGVEASVAETCFPVKVYLGHVLNLLEKKVDYLWIPSIINMPSSDQRMNDSFVCPYMQSLAYTTPSAVDFSKHDVEILRPVLYLAENSRQWVAALLPLAKKLGKSPSELVQALEEGFSALRTFQDECSARGKEILENLSDDAPAIVVAGRSYNTCDPGSNLELTRKLRAMGVLAIPMDYLPLETVTLPRDWFNMYWLYGQKILSAAELIAEDRRLNTLCLTNFGCGPDSFITRFFSERLGTKPMLTIEVDEHSADAGVITRCEAYLDSLEANREITHREGRRFRPLSIERASARTILIPNMSPQAYGMAAAFQACGMNAQILPEPDEDTLYWGRKYTSGKECFPCIVTTGDMIKYTQRPDFDRDAVAFFMGGSGGPCRFGQYNTLQRMVLDDLGYEDVPIFAPNQASSFYNDLGIVGRKFLRLGWMGIVAVDILEKALFQTRPYEMEKGQTEQIFWESVDDVCRAIREKGSLPPLFSAMKRSRERFASLAIDRTNRRPVIGLVGEFYLRSNRFSNQDLVAQIETLGGEVWSAPVYEWFLYRNFRRSMRAALSGRHLFRLKNSLMDRVMKRDEHKLITAFEDYLDNAHEPPTKQILELAAPYIHQSFEGEAIMTVGKGIDFARKGLAGIVSVMPFTCLPGTISHAVMKRVRREEGGIPFLNMVYDGLEQSTDQTRLEAFMHQAREFNHRTG